MVEHQPSKLIVRVRFPSPAPIGGIPERPKGADCKSAVADFDGSNPSPTTIFQFKTAANVAVFYHMRFQFSTDGLFLRGNSAMAAEDQELRSQGAQNSVI